MLVLGFLGVLSELSWAWSLPGAFLEPSWSLPGAFLEPSWGLPGVWSLSGVFLEASWSVPGSFLEPSWSLPKQTTTSRKTRQPVSMSSRKGGRPGNHLRRPGLPQGDFVYGFQVVRSKHTLEVQPNISCTNHSEFQITSTCFATLL